MTVGDIIKKYLDDNGFDGLVCSDGECGCLKDELAPCENVNLDSCEPGYKVNCSADCPPDVKENCEHQEFCISTIKPKKE